MLSVFLLWPSAKPGCTVCAAAAKTSSYLNMICRIKDQNIKCIEYKNQLFMSDSPDSSWCVRAEHTFWRNVCEVVINSALIGWWRALSVTGKTLTVTQKSTFKRFEKHSRGEGRPSKEPRTGPGLLHSLFCRDPVEEPNQQDVLTAPDPLHLRSPWF